MRGVKFGTKHSYDDFGLYLKKKPVISPPRAKTHVLDVPGADGSLDLSRALTGYMMFEMRPIKMEFIVINGRNRWDTLFSEVMNYLHGQTMHIIFDDDPAYYYEGLIEVDSMACSKKTSTIVINANVQPYKLKVKSTADEWIWDQFNFEADAINEVRELNVNGSLTVTMKQCGSKRAIPVINVENADGLTVTFEGNTYDLENGANRIAGIKLFGDECVLQFAGQGKITIDHRGGSL